MVEVCAGTAQLSLSFKRLKIQCLPFDYSRTRHQTRTTVYPLDLTSPGAFDVLAELFMDPCIVYVHFPPPCGTASKARERPVPICLKHNGAPEPRPLRSKEFPLGLPGLTPIEQQRVSSANLIHALVIKSIYLCFQRHIPLSVETPPNSYF